MLDAACGQPESRTLLRGHFLKLLPGCVDVEAASPCFVEQSLGCPNHWGVYHLAVQRPGTSPSDRRLLVRNYDTSSPVNL